LYNGREAAVGDVPFGDGPVPFFLFSFSEFLFDGLFPEYPFFF
jgi:hypothetical protein